MSDHAFFIYLYNHYTWLAGESLWIQESEVSLCVWGNVGLVLGLLVFFLSL